MGNTVRIQGVLNRKYFREVDALEVFEELVNKPDWNTRKILTEAFIALGEKHAEGWTPPVVPNEITIGADIAMMLGQLGNVIAMLENMDITQLRQVQGFDESTFNLVKAQGLSRGASNIISGETEFEDEEF
jgi:hypothetical protein